MAARGLPPSLPPFSSYPHSSSTSRKWPFLQRPTDQHPEEREEYAYVQYNGPLSTPPLPPPSVLSYPSTSERERQPPSSSASARLQPTRYPRSLPSTPPRNPASDDYRRARAPPPVPPAPPTAGIGQSPLANTANGFGSHRTSQLTTMGSNSSGGGMSSNGSSSAHGSSSRHARKTPSLSFLSLHRSPHLTARQPLISSPTIPSSSEYYAHPPKSPKSPRSIRAKIQRGRATSVASSFGNRPEQQQQPNRQSRHQWDGPIEVISDPLPPEKVVEPDFTPRRRAPAPGDPRSNTTPSRHPRFNLTRLASASTPDLRQAAARGPLAVSYAAGGSCEMFGLPQPKLKPFLITPPASPPRAERSYAHRSPSLDNPSRPYQATASSNFPSTSRPKQPHVAFPDEASDVRVKREGNEREEERARWAAAARKGGILSKSLSSLHPPATFGGEGGGPSLAQRRRRAGSLSKSIGEESDEKGQAKRDPGRVAGADGTGTGRASSSSIGVQRSFGFLCPSLARNLSSSDSLRRLGRKEETKDREELDEKSAVVGKSGGGGLRKTTSEWGLRGKTGRAVSSATSSQYDPFARTLHPHQLAPPANANGSREELSSSTRNSTTAHLNLHAQLLASSPSSPSLLTDDQIGLAISPASPQIGLAISPSSPAYARRSDELRSSTSSSIHRYPTAVSNSGSLSSLQAYHRRFPSSATSTAAAAAATGHQSSSHPSQRPPRPPSAQSSDQRRPPRASYLSHSASRSEPPSNLAPPLAPFPSPLFVVETATVRAAPIHPLRSFSPPRVPLPPLPATAPFSSIGRDPSWPSSHPKLARKTARPPLGAEDDEEEGHRGEKALQTGWSFPPSPHVGKLEIEGEERGGEGDLTRSSTPSDSGLVGVPFFSYQSEDYDDLFYQPSVASLSDPEPNSNRRSSDATNSTAAIFNSPTSSNFQQQPSSYPLARGSDSINGTSSNGIRSGYAGRAPSSVEEEEGAEDDDCILRGGGPRWSVDGTEEGGVPGIEDGGRFGASQLDQVGLAWPDSSFGAQIFQDPTSPSSSSSLPPATLKRVNSHRLASSPSQAGTALTAPSLKPRRSLAGELGDLTLSSPCSSSPSGPNSHYATPSESPLPSSPEISSFVSSFPTPANSTPNSYWPSRPTTTTVRR